MNNGDVIAGDGVVYAVSITIPSKSWVDLDVVFEGGTDFPAANVRVATTGTVAYVTPVWLCESSSGAQILVKKIGVYLKMVIMILSKTG